MEDSDNRGCDGDLYFGTKRQLSHLANQRRELLRSHPSSGCYTQQMFIIIGKEVKPVTNSVKCLFFYNRDKHFTEIIIYPRRHFVLLSTLYLGHNRSVL